MKKCLLLLMVVMLNFSITQAQNQGYSWTFGAVAPYNSSAAMTGSAGSHPLTVIDFTETPTSVVSEAVGLGTSCTGPINVTKWGGPPDYFLFGLIFENAPQVVSNVYTIEMTVKFDATGNYHRLIAFSDQWTPPGTGTITSDDGIYITPDPGQIIFRVGGGEIGIGSANLLDSTWLHLTFIRTADNFIQFYLNGVYQDAYDDAGLNFLAKPAVGNRITFIRDDDPTVNPEEVGGSIAKLSIYNRALTVSEIQTRTFNNICNTTDLLPQNPTEGYQWVLNGASPYPATAAVTGSVGAFGLFNIADPITTGTSENPTIGASCTAAVPIGTYPVNSGLEFQNTPRYVYDTYTIEMAVSIDDVGGPGHFTRLVGFNDLGDPILGDDGIYINEAGNVEMAFGGGAFFEELTGGPLTSDTWFHLVFTRNAAGLISYYRNGVLIDTYNDVAGDFVPKQLTGYFITLFKDDDGDESAGKLAKAAIFNVPLALTDVQERFNTICNTNLVVLPVSLKLFTAVKVDKQVELTWTTAMEENNLGFEVQRSKDGITYTTIGFVKGSGTSSQDNTYRFTDIAPLGGNNYYRLKQIDITNFGTFSTIRRINMDKIKQDIHLFPNPARGTITITNIKAGDQLSIFNIQGNLVARKTASGGQESVSVEKFASGVYMLQVTDRDNSNRIIRFTKF